MQTKNSANIEDEYLEKRISLLFAGVRARSKVDVERVLNNLASDPSSDSAAYFAEKLFLRDSSISDEQLDLLLSLSSIQGMHNIVLALANNYKRDFYNPDRVERFLFEVGEYTDANHHRGVEFERLRFVSDNDLSSVVRLIACKCLKADVEVAVEMGLKLIRQMRLISNLSRVDFFLHHDLMLAGYGVLVDSKRSLNCKARDFQVVSIVVSELSLDVSDEYLGDLLPKAIELAQRANAGMYTNASAEALINNREMIMCKLMDVLEENPGDAMRVFGNRTKQNEGSKIFRSMAALAACVSESDLDEGMKTMLCTRLVQVASEGKTKAMDTLMISDVVKSAGSYVDYPSLMKIITHRGTTNLIKSGVDTSQFNHLLEREHRGMALDEGLGL